MRFSSAAGCWLHMLNLVQRMVAVVAPVATTTALHIALFMCAKWIEIESISYCIGRLAIAVCNGTECFWRCLKYYAENSGWYQVFGYLIARFKFDSKQLHWKCPSCKDNCCVHCTRAWIDWKNSVECAIGFSFRIFCFECKHGLWLYAFTYIYMCVCTDSHRPVVPISTLRMQYFFVCGTLLISGRFNYVFTYTNAYKPFGRLAKKFQWESGASCVPPVRRKQK